MGGIYRWFDHLNPFSLWGKKVLSIRDKVVFLDLANHDDCKTGDNDEDEDEN